MPDRYRRSLLAVPRETLSILRGAATAFRRAPLRMLLAMLLAQTAGTVLLAPLGAAAVDVLVRRSGDYAVANEDLLRFLLSPIGLLVLAAGGTLALVSAGIGRAAVLVAAEPGWTTPWAAPASVVAALRRLPTLAALAGRQLVQLALLAAPWAAVIGVIAWLVVRGTDPYWLVTARPPRLWIGAACAAPVLLVGAFLVVRRAVLWSFALPLCVLERRRPGAALIESAALLGGRLHEHVHGRSSVGLRSVAASRLAWLAASSLCGLIALMAATAAAEALLRREWSSLLVTAWAAGAALLGHTVVVSVVALLGGTGDILIVRAAWRRVAGLEDAPDPEVGEVASELAWRRIRRTSIALLALLAGAALVATIGAVGLIESINQPLRVELTAHRGAARAAPENTLAAIRAAIAQGADRIEIDVMRSADGELVVFHDTDLRRIAGDRRQVADLSLAELRTFDVGTWFDSAFQGEQIPTLDEALEISAGRVPLNIELKARGDDAALAAATVACVRAHGQAGGRDAPERRDELAIVTSLSLRALAALREADPTIPIGLVVAASMGDLHRADVDLLSVETALATPDLLARASRAKLPVHVWSVSDPDLFTRLALRGVDGVITDDVTSLRARLEELLAMDDLERLLLAFRARLLDR